MICHTRVLSAMVDYLFAILSVLHLYISYVIIVSAYFQFTFIVVNWIK